MPHPDHRSVSSICKFVRCPRLYYWYKVLGVERASAARNLAMRFGSGIHAAAPYTHLGDIEGALEAFAVEWADGDDYLDKKRSTRVAQRIVYEMTDLHTGGGCGWVVVPPETKSEVDGQKVLHEREFDVDFELPSAKSVTGRIDAVGSRGDGELCVVEYKTTSQLWGSFGELFGLSPQMLTYVAAMQLAGLPVWTTLVEGILVAASKAEITVVPGEVSKEDIEMVLAWWKRQDGALSALEAADPDGTAPATWPCEIANCNPYACYGLQGFQCEYAPLCNAGARWTELVSMYDEVKKETESAKS